MDPLRRKCDSASRAALARNRPAEQLEVLVRVDRPSPATKAALEGSGLTVRTITGPIATGIISAGRLTQLAALPFVLRVELSRALFPED